MTPGIDVPRNCNSLIGIGVDIVSVKRVADVYNKYPDTFAKRILSESELIEFQKARNKGAFLAKRFAAKEAVSKALGTGMTQGLCFARISVDHEPGGRPVIRLQTDSVADFRTKDLQIHLSISDECDYAIAYVMIMSGKS